MRRIVRKPVRKLLGDDRSGVAIVEFALLVPVLFTLFLGSYETARLLLAYLKLEAAAETAADLVGQTPQQTSLIASGSATGWDFGNINSAVTSVMTPLPTTGSNPAITYASITYSGCSPTCTATVDWVYPAGSTTFGSKGGAASNLPNGAATTTLGSNNNDSVIVAQVVYNYTSPLGGVLHTNWTLTESAFNRPRYVPCVPSYLNTTPGTCP